MDKKKIAVTLGIMCMILTIAIIVQINTIKSANETVSQIYAENPLRDEVLRWKEKYDNAYKELEECNKELDKIREIATKNNSSNEEIQKNIKINNNLLGMTTLTGKGVIITVEDDPNATRENIGIENIEDHIVHYWDIIDIVNELKNAGAEAISVNGQRIVSTTPINCIGNVIKINDEKINSPFVIKAIGFPESLVSLDRPGSYIEYLRDYGIVVNIKKSDNIEVEKYAGLLSAKFMKFQK